MEGSEEVNCFAAAHCGPQGDIAGDVCQALMEGNGVAPGVAAEEFDGSCVGSQQAKEYADCCGLSCAVWAEKSVDFAALVAEVEAVQRRE